MGVESVCSECDCDLEVGTNDVLGVPAVDSDALEVLVVVPVFDSGALEVPVVDSGTSERVLLPIERLCVRVGSVYEGV